MLRKPRIGLLTFSDGREYTHVPQIQENLDFQSNLAARLEELGLEVVTGDLVWSNATAQAEARKLAQAEVDATIFNYAVWAFPQFSVVASHFAPGPILLFGQVNPAKPGMVSVLAAAGALEQIGRVPARVFGSIREPEVEREVLAFARGAHAARALKGQTFGLVGGRSIGINTAVSNTDQLARVFGVDVEHIDQLEIVARAERIQAEEGAKVKAARAWLEGKVRKVDYDGQQLTPALLERQIASYYAAKELIAKFGLDFMGIKGQPELTERFATMDLAEAFLNDPYDWDGPHEPFVCSTEADTDAALTMQALKHITGTPVLFADVRHYLRDHGLLDLVNSGEHATYFAARSLNPDENLKLVDLRPQGFYFPAGGAAVCHVAAPGEATFARLSRLDGRYRLHVLRGEFVRLDEQTEAGIIEEVQPNWPHAFAKLGCTERAFLQNFPANHVHAVYGNVVPELLVFARALGIDVTVLEGDEARRIPA
ncbi:MAG TPA: L-fucose/L-arabinose isomerase family protein [Deinococcales bacterium]|nr:L-fucose/L-arabinose isomerase family protein [Deinococcales bacterium]